MMKSRELMSIFKLLWVCVKNVKQRVVICMSRSTTINKWRGKEVGEDEDDQLFAMPLYMFIR